MYRPLSSPSMIGRDAELARLEAALRRAVAGVTSAVIVGGEAGVGKSRLVREFVARAAVDGVRVWWGECVPLAEGLLPFAPIAQVLRSVVAELGAAQVAELAGGGVDSLAMLVPELATGSPAVTAEPTVGRLHAAVLGLAERLATEPTIVVVEDLHWAGPSTCDLLHALIRTSRHARLVMIMTYRDDELSRGHPARILLAEAERRGAERLPVPRLGPGETSAQVAGILDAEPDPAVADRVFARSGGNPFLVEELLAAGPEGAALPESLRDILLLRVHQAPPVVVQLLRLVAFAGGRADDALLERATGLPADDLLAALRLAVEEHLLVPDSQGYGFRHALMTEAIVADVLPGEERAFHASLAEALAERLPASGPAAAGGPAMPCGHATAGPSALASAHAELAHHWLRARRPELALVSTVEAGLAAERAVAFAEARAFFVRAVELWQHAPADVPLDLVEVYRRGAECAFLVGDIEQALALVREAIAGVDPRAEPTRAAMLHERLGRYVQGSGSPTPP